MALEESQSKRAIWYGGDKSSLTGENWSITEPWKPGDPLGPPPPGACIDQQHPGWSGLPLSTLQWTQFSIQKIEMGSGQTKKNDHPL